MSRHRISMPVILTLMLSYLGHARADFLYAARNNGTITRIDTATRVETTFASGLSNANAMAFDASGNLFVANQGGNTIEKITPGGVGSVFATGIGDTFGMAFDAKGNLFVANQNSGKIEKITPGGVASVFATGLGGAYGLAFDGSGNLFVAENGPNVIEKITPNGVVSQFASTGGLFYPTGLAFDGSGNLFVANELGTVAKFTPQGVGSNFAGTGLAGRGTAGLAIDTAGNIYASSTLDNHGIEKFTPAGVGSLFESGAPGSPVFLAIQPTAVPEPTGLVMMGTAGALALLGSAWGRHARTMRARRTSLSSPEIDGPVVQI